MQDRQARNKEPKTGGPMNANDTDNDDIHSSKKTSRYIYSLPLSLPFFSLSIRRRSLARLLPCLLASFRSICYIPPLYMEYG
jgi:hypothetical protein